MDEQNEPGSQPIGNLVEDQASAPDERAGDQAALNDLKIGAHLEIGMMILPLRGILNMKVGEVLPLDRPLSAQVRVLAGGRTIATGDLVASNGFFAVKIKDVSELSRHLPLNAGLS